MSTLPRFAFGPGFPVRVLLIAAVLSGGARGGVSQSNAQSSSTQSASRQSDGCTLNRGVYTCNWEAFRVRFAQAHTIAVPVQPLERATEKRLHQLAETLGKRVVAPEQMADLTFCVVPASAGDVVAIGPADQPLARLLVSLPGSNGSPETLLWAETFVGQADRPWPIVVNALANQFEARFHHGR